MTRPASAAYTPLYAVSWVAGGGDRKAVVVQASDPEEAVAMAKDQQSVWALKHGVVFSVWRLDNFPEKFHVAYDKEPMTESHGATDAVLVTSSLGRSHV